MLICHLPTLSLEGIAVGALEYSLCNFRQLAYIRLTIHKYTHLLSPDTASDRIYRWLNRGFSLQL